MLTATYIRPVAHSHKWRLFVLALTVLCLVQIVSAQILVTLEYRGKKVTCGYSGLRGVAKSCGAQGYERVFTGTVRSLADVGDTDKLLGIEPDEVFVGDSSRVTAITNQACLRDEIHSGDKWLFYLSRDSKSQKLEMSYGSPSKPIVGAKEEISMLRDLGRLSEAGILTGTVELLVQNRDGKKFSPLANHRIVAKNEKVGSAYEAMTNTDGYFWFELPPGWYNITAAPEFHFEEVDTGLSMMRGSVPVKQGECWEHDFTVEQTKRSTHTSSKLATHSSTRSSTAEVHGAKP